MRHAKPRTSRVASLKLHARVTPVESYVRHIHLPTFGRGQRINLVSYCTYVLYKPSALPRLHPNHSFTAHASPDPLAWRTRLYHSYRSASRYHSCSHPHFQILLVRPSRTLIQALTGHSPQLCATRGGRVASIILPSHKRTQRQRSTASYA